MATIEIRVARHNSAFGKARRMLERMGGVFVGADNTARHSTIRARTPLDAGPEIVTALQRVEGVLSVRTR